MFSYISSITRQERSVLLFVFSAAAFGFGALGTSAVLLNLYIVKLGFDITYVGIINASSMAIFALTSLPAGWFGYRFGLRGSLILGFVLTGLCLAVFLMIPWLPRSTWAAGLLITYCFVTAAVSVVVVNASPYLMGICIEKDRHTAFTLQTATMSLFAFLGALVGGFLPGFLIRLAGNRLSEASADNAVLWLNVVGYFGAALLMYNARPAPPLARKTETAQHEPAPVSLLIFLTILFSLQISSDNTIGMLLNVYFQDTLLVSARLIGIIFGIARLLPFFLSPLQPLVLNRWGPGRTMNAGYFLVGVSAVAMALIPAWEVTAILFILVRLALSFSDTARGLFGQESVLPRWRTAVGAVSTISMAVGPVLVGFGGSQLVTAAGFRGLFLSGGAMATLAILLYSQRMLIFRQSHPKTPIMQAPLSK